MGRLATGLRQADMPFCFWLGSRDPHRPYQVGSGQQSGKNPVQVIVPPHLPDNSVTRNDILDYYVEVERFDSNVERSLNLLTETGQLDNMLVAVTAITGCPPPAKASLYDHRRRVPLAVSWHRAIPAGPTADDFISLSDRAPTFLKAAGLESHPSRNVPRPVQDAPGLGFHRLLEIENQVRELLSRLKSQAGGV